jgi:hypothetical protein
MEVGGAVIRVAVGGGTYGTPSAGLGIRADCSALSAVFGRPACARDDTALTKETSRELQQLLHIPQSPTLVATGATDPSVVYIVARDDAATESALRTDALRADSAMTVYSPAELAPRQSPLVSWIAAGLSAFSILIGLALAAGMLDRTAGAASYRATLLAIGVEPRQATRLQIREQVSALGVVCGGSALIGALIAYGWFRLDPSARYPLVWIVALGCAGMAVGLVAVLIGALAANVTRGGMSAKAFGGADR